MRMLPWLLVLLSIGAVAASGVDRLAHHMWGTDGPGGVIAVVGKSRVLHLKGYGYADVDRQTPITPQTRFDLASCSKQFTAVSVLLLASRGQIALNDDVRRYLPELPKYPETVRLIDMLHMESGLPEYEDDGSDVPDAGKMTNEDTLHEVAAAGELTFKPRAKYEYVNANYSLLALVVERVTKQSLRDFEQREIFGPCGMTHTEVQDARHHLSDFARGYARKGKGFKPDHVLVTANGDGNVFTCADDFIKWDAAVRRRAILPAASWKIAFTSGKLRNGKESGYGCGYEIGSTDDHTCYYHSGSWNGTSTYYEYFPDDGLSVIALSNIYESVDDDTMDAIAKLYLR